MLFWPQKEGERMTDERRLVSIGVPLEDAITICLDLRRDGGLEEYIRGQESEYRRRCARYVEEVIG